MSSIIDTMKNQVIASDIIGNVVGLHGPKKSLGDAIKGKLASDDLRNTFGFREDAPVTTVETAPAVAARAQPAGANEEIARRRAAQRRIKGANTILSESDTLG